ncbi:4666_t:CDS:2, partial [Dentiscutata erythropus]
MTFFTYSENLRKDLYQLLHNSNDYNVLIQVGKDPEIEIFNAHSNILCARSSYFKTALSERWANCNDDGKITFVKTNIAPITFRLILQYIYTGVLDLTDQSPSNILALLIASDELTLDELIQCSQEYLIKKESSWLRENFTSTLHIVNKHQSCEKLHQHLKISLYLDPKPFFNSEDLLNLDKDIFLEFIQNDFLNAKEIDIWNFLLKWAKASHDVNSDNMVDDYICFKGLLDPFIPHIRFHEMSGLEFYEYVRPNRAFISGDLYGSLEDYFITKRNPILRPRCGPLRIDSVLIDKYKAAVITNWIEKRDFFIKKPSYQFEPIYKATHGEFNLSNFIESCGDRVSAVLILIKASNSTKIIGGYNPLGLKVKYHNNHILSRVKISSQAILNYSGSWINFGNSDLVVKYENGLNGLSGLCAQNSYEKKILNSSNTKFAIEILEIFT